MSRRSNSFVVAALDLPSWADYTALPNGNFIEFTTNTPQDALMPGQVMANWCGGEFVPDYGARGGVGYVGGGEHFPWTDSRADGGIGQQGAYVLDCDARVFVRKCYPVVDHTGSATGVAGSTTDSWGAYADDGSPQSKHTYNCVSYMPAAWGGGASGSLVSVAKSGGLVSGTVETQGPSATWKFDLSKANHTAANPAVAKITGTQTYNFGSGVPAIINDAPTSCIDHTRQGWWAGHRAGASWGDRMVFTSKTGVISAPQGVSRAMSYSGMHHFADDDILVRFPDDGIPDAPGNMYTQDIEWQVWVWQAGTSNPWVRATVNRQSIADYFTPGPARAYPPIGFMHPRWSTILGCFVGLDFQYPWGGGTTTTVRVWKLTPPPPGQRFSGTWQFTWELVTAKPGTEATNFMLHNYNIARHNTAGRNGVYGKFVECPSLRAFVWVRDVDKKGQLVRLLGM